MKQNQNSDYHSLQFTLKVIVKGLFIFTLCGLVFSLIQPVENLGKISAYNLIFPGRKRLPYGERPDLAYNLSINTLTAMFASHEINAASKPENEFRVLVIGDSSVWGYLLHPEDTLSEQLNQMQMTMANGKIVHVYNLGYPTLSATKDLLLLDAAAAYKPDLIIWLVTLESLAWEKQFASPIVQANYNTVSSLFTAHEIPLPDINVSQYEKSWWDETIIGQRRNLADIFRLQFYGILWSATQIDQAYPEAYDPPQQDLAADDSYYKLSGKMLPVDIAIPVLQAGIEEVGSDKVLIVNEPIFISSGLNSDIRYNFFYPRWAYDSYRDLMDNSSWSFLDAWDIVPSSEFTNSAIHLSPKGTGILAEVIASRIRAEVNTRLEH